jgi:hypothetical protein
MSGMIDRARLSKVLALLASPVDGEALAAARKAVELLAAAGLRPEQLVDGLPDPDPFGLANFVYSPSPAAHPPRSARSATQPKPPPAPSFRDLGPAAARGVLDELIASRMLQKHVLFCRSIRERLYARPHEGLTTGEVHMRSAAA